MMMTHTYIHAWLLTFSDKKSRTPTATVENTSDSEIGMSVPSMESKSHKAHHITRTGSKRLHPEIR